MKLKTIAVIFGSCVVTVPAYADNLVVMLDISSSTPIVEPNFLRAAMPLVSEKIAKLPLGSTVDIMTVGDDKKKPLSYHFFVQRIKTHEGDSAANLSRAVPGMITSYLKQVRANPTEKMQNESSLSPGFLDASKFCKKDKPCETIFFTDGMEFQPGVIAYPRDYKKPLPTIEGLNLNGMTVTLYGVGQCSQAAEANCATSRFRIAIEKQWADWFQKHHAGAVEIRRL